MAGPIHTYGPTCFLADDEGDAASLQSSPTPPKVRAQFFYTSALPIDDPLTSLPPPSGSSLSSKTQLAPQPFSARDNAALENAWRSLRHGLRTRGAVRQDPGASAPRSIPAINATGPVSGANDRSVNRMRTAEDVTQSEEQGAWQANLPSATGASMSGSYRVKPPGDPGALDPTVHMPSHRQINRLTPQDARGARGQEGMSSHASWERQSRAQELGTAETERRPASARDNEDTGADSTDNESVHGNPSRDASISGSPFMRAPTGLDRSSPTDSHGERPPEPKNIALHKKISKPSSLRASETQDEQYGERARSPTELDAEQSAIPVGVSKLHLVELPNLKMKPIYWSPLHDISEVLRATWFYKNTMLPIETELANRLEEGYQYLKPWTETWQDELNSCVEIGADAELKIVHPLWSKEEVKSSTRPATSQGYSSSPVQGKAETASPGAADALVGDENQAAGGLVASYDTLKPYKSSSVIYVDARNAQILRPSLLPSVARGRRPLSAIRKGQQIGIPVVRGFSRKAWDRLHPSKVNPVDVRHYLRRTQSRKLPKSYGGQICYACQIEEARPDPTDLVLVIHGIGQKLSERMESFHFTHAINAFRRSVNMELHSDPVWSHVRADHGGIMVLPVNWRTTLSLADSNLETPSADTPGSNRFSLEDITPETIPAVRSLISDVMLDIPYYLSHHKPKMIQAAVTEANRIYRLWCKNNPGFQERGRVHLIGHSLGSIMALDILSHQPTQVPRFNFDETDIHVDIFEFDTGNLFLCGSPAGLFLLLNKANLLPRRGKNKPGSEGEDQLPGVAGDADTYGCLAVDNIYNIMHTTDPIAYRVNAAVDSELASSLKAASLPTSSTSLFQSFGSALRWTTFSPTMLPATATAPIRPSMTSDLPSNVELETHDFTREEIAERRMQLLNDNGQIDYFISGGGGPLNIQYLNMLSAHSSYWILTDFVRFLVVEIARKQGRDGVLPVLRAEKKKNWKIHKG